MDKVLDIKLDEIEKEIRGISISYQNGNQRRKTKYSIYNPNMSNMLDDIKNNLSEELDELMIKNRPYKNWNVLTKFGLALSALYILYIMFTVTYPTLLYLIPLIIGISPSIVMMSMGDKKDIKREQHVLEMLKNIEKADDFIKVKGIHKVKVVQEQLARSFQSSINKTIRSVRRCASDVISSIEERDNQEELRRPSSEELKAFRKQIVNQINNDDYQKRNEVDDALNRLEQLASSSRKGNGRGRR